VTLNRTPPQRQEPWSGFSGLGSAAMALIGAESDVTRLASLRSNCSAPRLTLSFLVMNATDELEIREVEEQLRARLRRHDVMDHGSVGSTPAPLRRGLPRKNRKARKCGPSFLVSETS
ncbi:MAG TPA: hypothetical protein VFY54_14815, partial [Rubrobacter sp.]|nr:hypothetical protein [Rubrobacter sp.]